MRSGKFDPLEHLPEYDETRADRFILGENPSHDQDTMAQYMDGLASVGLRNEIIVDYSGRNIFEFVQATMIDEVRNIGRGAQMLTVGAGTGEMEYNVAKRTFFRNPRIVATDLYPHYHGYQGRAIEEGLDCIEFAQVDARELPYEDNSMHFAAAPFVIYHILGERGGPEHAVAELHRVTKPGAKTLVATRGPRHMRQLWDQWLPDITEYLSGQSSMLEYKPPITWYPNCDLERTSWLLNTIYGNRRATFYQVSPEHLELTGSPSRRAEGDYINIPATPEGWERVRWIIHAFQHNIRPVPPQSPRLTEAIDAVVKDDFFSTAARNGGFYPLEIEQAVFEAIKIR